MTNLSTSGPFSLSLRGRCPLTLHEVAPVIGGLAFVGAGAVFVGMKKIFVDSYRKVPEGFIPGGSAWAN